MLEFLTVALAVVALASADYSCSYGGSGLGLGSRPGSGSSSGSGSGTGSYRSDTKGIQWTGGTFDWPCESTKNMYKSSGRYISKNIIATRSVVYKDEAFVALPRFKSGVPATLAKVSLKNKYGGQSILSPYPCWSLQEEGNCAALQSVVDLFLDPQDILWALDTGVVNELEDPIRRCPPKVMAFNLKTGKVVKTVDLSSRTTASSRLQYVVADYSVDGRVFIYVTDADAGAILVYDVTSGQSYRVLLPQSTNEGCATKDVLYPMLLRRADGTTCLIFSYMGSNRLFSLRTDYLQNGKANGKIHDLGRKPSNMVFLGTDNGSAVFFRYEGQSDVYRWDANTCFSAGNFQKVSHGNDCSLATQVTPDYKRGKMRVLESNFPDFLQGTVGCGTDHALNILGGPRCSC